VTILRAVAGDVLAHARDDAPRECCGILLGTGERILESVRARNLAEGTTRFLLDPRDHVAALRDARARHLEIVGFYHSHPRSAAYPSETDLAESAYPGVIHLIAGQTPAGPELRLFTWDGDGRVEELPLHVTPA
jgi:[CysO sulfur-carrier protein]-S-L-cysteine hydrolase